MAGVYGFRILFTIDGTSNYGIEKKLPIENDESIILFWVCDWIVKLYDSAIVTLNIKITFFIDFIYYIDILINNTLPASSIP